MLEAQKVSRFEGNWEKLFHFPHQADEGPPTCRERARAQNSFLPRNVGDLGLVGVSQGEWVCGGLVPACVIAQPEIWASTQPLSPSLTQRD